MTYHIESTWGAIPNQATGTINGDFFYFRACRGFWEIMPFAGSDECILDGVHPNAGWWTEEETRHFLTALLEEHYGPA